MNFENQIPFPAYLHREAISRDRIAGAAIVRATFELGSPCRASLAQPWRVSPTHWQGPRGPMPPDAIFDREDCDLILFGDAVPPTGRPTTSLEVSVQAEDFRASVLVMGDRIWKRDGERLVPSAPEPFTRMPLGLERAYGGMADFDGLALPFADNPQGKG